MKNRPRLNEKVAETQKNIKETTTLSQQKHRKSSKKLQHSLKEKVAKTQKNHQRKKATRIQKNIRNTTRIKKVIKYVL